MDWSLYTSLKWLCLLEEKGHTTLSCPILVASTNLSLVAKCQVKSPVQPGLGSWWLQKTWYHILAVLPKRISLWESSFALQDLDLSKPRCCHFNLLQPQQSDINKGNCPNFKVIPKGNYSRYFENLWNAFSALNIMKYQDQQLKCLPYCQIFSPVGHKDISGSRFLYQSMKM